MNQLENIQPSADWEEYLLCDVANTTSGGTPNRSKKEFYQGAIPWVKSGELNDNFLDGTEEHISEEGLKKSSAKLFPTGALLMAMYGATVGKTAILKIEAATNQAVCGIFPDETKANTEFLRYQLIFFRKKLLSERYGGAQPNISQTIIKNIRLRLPPLPEQQRIAYILSTVQTAIEQQARLIKLIHELKSALMNKLFTEGLHGEKQKTTEIGLVPKSWEQVPLEKAGDVIYGIQAAVANNFKPIGMKILTNKNITLDGQIILDEINYFELKTKRHFETVLQKGDILFNWRSGSKEHIGKTAYFNLDGEYTHSSFILRIRSNDNVSSRFLFWYLYFLRSSGYFLQKHDISSVNATFNKSAVDALAVFLPSKDEQEEIAAIFDTVDTKVNILKQKQDVQEELFRTLLHQLMTGQTRVNEVDLPGLS
jgi:type I restriction enzyme S subunit